MYVLVVMLGFTKMVTAVLYAIKNVLLVIQLVQQNAILVVWAHTLMEPLVFKLVQEISMVMLLLI
jgi:hypothetical protein